jgi:3-polyprenyl-4-hydroxybenzoate decarboxylase
MNGRIDCRNEIPLSVSTNTQPAFVLIAAAPITTHKDGVTSSGLISEKKIR